MIFTVVGDVHAKNSNLDLVNELFRQVEELGNPVVWLGDLLDTKEVIRGKSLNTLIEKFKNSKLFHYVIVGNHDWFNLECKAHSLESLKLLDNVKVIDSVWTDWESVFVPYIHDREQLRAELERLPSEVTVFGHFDVRGYDYGNGHLCKDGLELSDLSKFKRVISGHFHKFQHTDNFTYLGTPFSQSFGESNQNKFLGLYDTDTFDLDLIPSPFRKHVTIEFNCDLLNEEKNHWLFDIEDPTWKENKYRVILTGTKENINRFPRWMYDQGGTEGKLDIKWVSRPSDFAMNDVSIDETTSNEAQFSKWATEVKQLDQETVSLGLYIMGAVK